MDLTKKKCVPCKGGEPSLTAMEIAELQPRVPSWKVRILHEHPVLERIFAFKDFAESVDFVNKVKDVAEAEGHHPDLHIHWNTVRVVNWTHAIGGLHENDFILAAKIDQLKK